MWRKIPYPVNLTGIIVLIDVYIMFTKKRWIVLKYLLGLQKPYAVTIHFSSQILAINCKQLFHVPTRDPIYTT